MALSDSQKTDLEKLVLIFGKVNSFFFDETTKIVYERVYDEKLVAEDERYEYLGKIDDSAPGVRYRRLGTFEEYKNYIELQRISRQD